MISGIQDWMTGGVNGFRLSPYLVPARLCKHISVPPHEPHNAAHVSHMLRRPESKSRTSEWKFTCSVSMTDKNNKLSQFWPTYPKILRRLEWAVTVSSYNDIILKSWIWTWKIRAALPWEGTCCFLRGCTSLSTEASATPDSEDAAFVVPTALDTWAPEESMAMLLPGSQALVISNAPRNYFLNSPTF